MKLEPFRYLKAGIGIISAIVTIASVALVSDPAHACGKPRDGGKLIIRLPDGTIVVIGGRVLPDGTIDPDVGVPIDLFGINSPTACRGAIGFGEDPVAIDLQLGILNTVTGDFNPFTDSFGDPIFSFSRRPDLDSAFEAGGDPDITDWYAFEGLVDSFNPDDFPLNGVDEEYVAFFNVPDPLSSILGNTVQIALGSQDPAHPVVFTPTIPVKTSESTPLVGIFTLGVLGTALTLKQKQKKTFFIPPKH